jgi:hypothetical protein
MAVGISQSLRIVCRVCHPRGRVDQTTGERRHQGYFGCGLCEPDASIHHVGVKLFHGNTGAGDGSYIHALLGEPQAIVGYMQILQEELSAFLIIAGQLRKVCFRSCASEATH